MHFLQEHNFDEQDSDDEEEEEIEISEQQQNQMSDEDDDEDEEGYHHYRGNYVEKSFHNLLENTYLLKWQTGRTIICTTRDCRN